jgi:phenylacetic acid degradation operon negative regulatory protein
MEASELQQIISRVAGCGPIKVWSVVVTVLGDLLRHPEESLGAQELDAIVAPIGINNQALRVAVHRLRNDGWVETQKVGRRSRHQLTKRGWEETQRVSPMIYNALPDLSVPIRLVVGPPQIAAASFADQLPKDGAVLTSRSGLVAGAGQVPETWISAPYQVQSAPDWVKAAVLPAGLSAEYEALREIVGSFLRIAVPEDPVSRAALRLVILHHWRRLRLRHGALPDLVLREAWAGARTRAVVIDALGRFSRPELSALT